VLRKGLGIGTPQDDLIEGAVPRTELQKRVKRGRFHEEGSGYLSRSKQKTRTIERKSHISLTWSIKRKETWVREKLRKNVRSRVKK